MGTHTHRRAHTSIEMFGRDFYYPRHRHRRFPASWMDFDDDDFFSGAGRSFFPPRFASMFDDDDDFFFPSFLHRRRRHPVYDMGWPFRRHHHHRRRPVFRPDPFFEDDFPSADPAGAGASTTTMMNPDEVHVKLLPDGRMEVRGGSDEQRQDGGRSYRCSRRFYRSMDVPDDLDVAHLRSLMDSNNELVIKKPIKLDAVEGAAPQPSGPHERIVPIRIEGRDF